MRKSQLPQNILIVRLSSLGDIALSSPLAEILKRHNPNAHIVWATQPESVELLESNPYIDELYIWDRSYWQDLWKRKRFISMLKECYRIHKELKEKNFQVAYDLQGLFKSGLVTWLSGATERIGIGSREGSYLFMHKMISKNIANRDQIGSEYRYLVNQLGYSDSDWHIKVHQKSPPINTVRQSLSSHIKPKEGYAVICPFAAKQEKHWQDKNWQQLLLRIRGRYQLKTVILGAREEGTRGQQLARQCGAINLAGATSIEEASTIIKGASLVVGVDNALTHLSQASNTPSIALFGPSRPYLYTDNENSKVIYLDKLCSPCQKKPICDGGFECMSEVTPDRVLTELKILMKNTNKNSLAL